MFLQPVCDFYIFGMFSLPFLNSLSLISSVGLVFPLASVVSQPEDMKGKAAPILVLVNCSVQGANAAGISAK